MIKKFCEIKIDSDRKAWEILSPYKFYLYGSSADTNVWPSYNGCGPLYFYPKDKISVIALGIETERGILNFLIRLNEYMHSTWIPPKEKQIIFRNQGFAVKIEDQWISTLMRDVIDGGACLEIANTEGNLICCYLADTIDSSEILGLATKRPH